MGIMDKLQKNSRIKETAILDQSKLFSGQEMVTTKVPMINVALSGDPDGGLTSGLTVLAGPSKHFKTSFGLLMAAAYLDKYEETASIGTEVKKLRNKALAELLNGSAASVNGTIDGSDDKDSAQGAYLKAVAAARQNNVDAVANNLKNAISKDSSLKAKAANDREFLKFADNATFTGVVK